MSNMHWLTAYPGYIRCTSNGTVQEAVAFAKEDGGRFAKTLGGCLTLEKWLEFHLREQESVTAGDMWSCTMWFYRTANVSLKVNKDGRLGEICCFWPDSVSRWTGSIFSDYSVFPVYTEDQQCV